MGFFSKLKSLSKAATREAVLQQGIAVEDVERQLPMFSGRNEFERTELSPCVRYPVKRRAGSHPPNWLFLQRSAKEGAQYKNGWLFEAEDTPSSSLHQALEKIATEWDEELLEFEATPSEVSAFWAEWGGADQVAVIRGYLSMLASA